MNSRIINQNEIDAIFYEELNQQQVTHIFKIIFILSQYIFLTTDMLVQIYKEKYDEKMGLSYLKRAVKERLIIEYQEDLDEPTEQKIFYYALKSSTILYLQQNRIPIIKMPPCAGHEEKSRLLTYTRYAIEKGYTLNQQMPLDLLLRYFITNQSTICYFSSVISLQQIKSELQKNKNELAYQFDEITTQIINVGKYTRAVDPRSMD